MPQHGVVIARHFFAQAALERANQGVVVLVARRHHEMVAPKMPEPFKDRCFAVQGRGGPGLHLFPMFHLPNWNANVALALGQVLFFGKGLGLVERLGFELAVLLERLHHIVHVPTQLDPLGQIVAPGAIGLQNVDRGGALELRFGPSQRVVGQGGLVVQPKSHAPHELLN